MFSRILVAPHVSGLGKVFRYVEGDGASAKVRVNRVAASSIPAVVWVFNPKARQEFTVRSQVLHKPGLLLRRYLEATTRLFFTLNTFGTPLARKFAKFLSASVSATPSSITLPFFTIM